MALAAGIASASHGGLKARSRSHAKQLVVRAHAAVDPSLTSAIGAFRQTTPLSVADSASLASLQRIMSASSDSSLPASGADLASARPAPIDGGSESVRIVVIVADGQTGPTVIDAQGIRSTIPVVENVAAAVLPGTDSVETANGHVTALSGFTAKLGSS